MPDAPIYIIVLTLRDSRYDMIHGFEAGADDYIPKPFRREELRVRLKAAQRIVELQATLAKRVEELQGALAHLHTLQGILPICSKCHKIRDNKDIWRQLEAYIEEHSEAMFSHSLCPECYKQFCIEAGIEPEDLSQPPKKDG
jgi:response regulator RpfG family c-di-GMP phosphodiesterase